MLIKIAEPRYHDKMALIAKFKVKDPNEIYTIVFTKSKFYKGKGFEGTGELIMRHNTMWNGTIVCYEVPLATLKEIKTDGTKQTGYKIN